MATITINVDDEMEKKFRDTVRTVIGDRKGSLGRAITEAMELWIRDKTQEKVARTALELMNREYHLGKRLFKGRKDLHERT